MVIELVFTCAADDGCGRGVRHTKQSNNSGIGLTLPLLLTEQFPAQTTDTSLTQWQLITAKVLYNLSYMKTPIKERRNSRVHTHTLTHKAACSSAICCALLQGCCSKDATRETNPRGMISVWTEATQLELISGSLWVKYSAWACVCVGVCVRERESEREGESQGLCSGNSCSFIGLRGGNKRSPWQRNCSKSRRLTSSAPSYLRPPELTHGSASICGTLVWWAANWHRGKQECVRYRDIAYGNLFTICPFSYWCLKALLDSMTCWRCFRTVLCKSSVSRGGVFSLTCAL